MGKRALDRATKNISLSNLARTLQDHSTAKSLQRDLRQQLDVHTPVGPLLAHLNLEMENGEPDVQWLVCNPFALLHHLCEKSLRFALLLVHSLMLAGDFYCGSVVLYCDETTHGNVQRPDMSNELQCIYWCIPELPSWFRARNEEWFRFGYLRTQTQKNIKGGLASLMRTIMRYFYNPDHFNFAVGMPIRLGSGGSTVNIKLPFRCFVQDEKVFIWKLKTKIQQSNANIKTQIYKTTYTVKMQSSAESGPDTLCRK
jgi:hypothetical protein